MKKEDLQQLGVEDLQKQLPLLRDKLRVLRFKKASNQLSQTHLIGEVKKTIAQVLTYLNQKK
jgi:large subunit ribosomal protein L29